MPRFFFGGGVNDGRAVLEADTTKHIKVLRLCAGDSVELCDGRGVDYAGIIRDITGQSVEVDIISSGPSLTEPDIFCTVYAAFSKGDKPEHIVQKSTELGAGEIVFFPSMRCVSRPEGRSLDTKLERLNKIALSAAEQSGRGVVPRVRAAESFLSAVKESSDAQMPLLLYESEQESSIADAFNSAAYRTASVMTGPEGGFDQSEASAAVEAGMRCVTVGRRILRCETAPLAALCAVMFHSGNMR